MCELCGFEVGQAFRVEPSRVSCGRYLNNGCLAYGAVPIAAGGATYIGMTEAGAWTAHIIKLHNVATCSECGRVSDLVYERCTQGNEYGAQQCEVEIPVIGGSGASSGI